MIGEIWGAKPVYRIHSMRILLKWGGKVGFHHLRIYLQLPIRNPKALDGNGPHAADQMRKRMNEPGPTTLQRGAEQLPALSK